MNDLELRLRDAGARVRDTAPAADATEAALASLGEVALDDGGADRRRRWLVGPAVVLAVAAAVVGIVVVTRPDETAVVPTGTTEVAPTTTVDASTTSTIAAASGVTVGTANQDFDGDGGACLTLSSATEQAQGCATGPQMRAAYGQPLYARLDGTPYALFPTGVDGAGEPELLRGDTAVPSCFATALLMPSALADVAGCDSQGNGILGVLPATPDGAVLWTVVSGDDSVDATELTEIEAIEALGTRVFRSPAAGVEESGCTIIAAPNDSVRELCGSVGTSTYLAGSVESPLVVTTDAGAGGATIEPLDPVTTLDLNECPELTAGELLGLLPEHGVTDSLLCRGEVAALRVAPTLVDPRFFETAWDVLRREDGTWSVAASEVDYTCTGGNGAGIAGEICSLLGVFDLAQMPPFPSATSLAGFVEAVGDASPLPGAAGIEEVPPVDVAADLPALAEAVATAIRESMGGDGAVEVFSTAAPIVIRRSNLDDSVTHTIYVLNAGPVDTGGVTVFANGTRAIPLCGRGATTLDGEPACI